MPVIESPFSSRPAEPWAGRPAFEALLCGLFDDADLRRWLALDPNLGEICDALPGSSTPLVQVVHKTTEILLQRGLLEACLFESLLKRFPKRSADIYEVWATWNKQARQRTIEVRPRPKYSNPEIQSLSDDLERAYQQRRQRVFGRQDTAEVDAEILRLRHRLRQGPQLKPGDFVHHGRFQLGHVLGSGGYATVWLAYDWELNIPVAVKVLHPQQSENRTVLERFERGARKTALMLHRNIIKVHRIKFEDGGYHAYVLEYASGGDLRTRAFTTGFTEPPLLEMFVQLCEGLEYCHTRGLIHRDIKPSNILLDAEDTPRLTDFDQVKAHDTTGGTSTGAGIGTVLYTAPETWNDADAADARSDLYSLGMSLLACLRRREIDLQVLRDPASYIRGVDASPRLKRLIERTISQTPAERPASAADLGQLLRKVADSCHESSPDESEASQSLEVSRFRGNLSRYLASDKWERDTYRGANGQKLISIVLDNICRMRVGAIVCGINQFGNAGLLGRNIAAAGGPSQVPVYSYDFKLPAGKVILAPGGKLASQYVLYVTQDDSPESLDAQLPTQVARIVSRTLQDADSLGIRSVAYPLLLTGVAGVSRDRILPLLFEALHVALPAAESVEEAFIVVYPYSEAVGLLSQGPVVTEGPRTAPPQFTFSMPSVGHSARNLPVIRKLTTNSDLSCSGARVGGLGFVLSDEERRSLIERHPRNAARIFPYLTADVVSRSPGGAAEQYIVDFEQMSLEAAAQWPDLLQFVRDRVKPERDASLNRRLRDYWWQLGASNPEFFRGLRGVPRCFVNPRVSRHLFFASCPTDQVFAHTLQIHATDSMSFFACVQSRLFSAWMQVMSSTLESDIRWDSEGFATFPFPHANPRANTPLLAGAGTRLYAARTIFMRASDRGMAETYEVLKDPAATDPEVLALRALHVELDHSVLAGFGWTDIPVPAYVTPGSSKEESAVRSFENAVVERLAALNASS